MSSKRKADHQTPGEPEKRIKESGFLHGFSLYLHPAALSKARKSIFQNQIKKHGGNLIDSLNEELECTEIVVLIEDQMIEKSKLENIVKMTRDSSLKDNQLTFIGFSWLSASLKDNELKSFKSYELTEAKTKPVVNLSTHTDTQADRLTEAKTKRVVNLAQPDHVTSSYIEKNKHKFACANASTTEMKNENPNKFITDELEKLAAAYKSTNDQWRAFGYQVRDDVRKNTLASSPFTKLSFTESDLSDQEIRKANHESR